MSLKLNRFGEGKGIRNLRTWNSLVSGFSEIAWKNEVEDMVTEVRTWPAAMTKGFYNGARGDNGMDEADDSRLTIKDLPQSGRLDRAALLDGES